jgi:hypothetical protein
MNRSLAVCSCFALLATTLVACGSSKGAGSPNPRTNSNDQADADTCDPTAAIPCFKGLAEPCKGLSSGFDGDEYCLAPPDPQLGDQIHTGPKDYDDPAETAKYIIQPGQETNWAEITQTSNSTTVYTRGYHSSMRPGSHHFIMYGLENTTVPTDAGTLQNGDGAESAVGAVGGTFLAGATKAIENIDTQGPNPEDQGIGSEVPPHRPIAMNLHFINTTDKPLLQEIWVNFIYIDGSKVTQYVRPIEWLGGLTMSIPPQAHTTLQSPPGACKAPEDLRVGMFIGHVHANTVRITTTMNDTEMLFEDYNWKEPTEWRYRRDVQNPTPDAVAKTGGGYSGILQVTTSDTFHWECEVENKSDVTLHFGNHVYTSEMCNVFGFYFSPNRDAPNWNCYF